MPIRKHDPRQRERERVKSTYTDKDNKTLKDVGVDTEEVDAEEI